MRRLLFTFIGLGAAGLLVVPTAVAQSAGDSVVGSGHVAATDFNVSVQAGPNGENPTGFLVLTGFLEFTATPTCLNVSGNAAVGGYRIDSGPFGGQGFLAEAVDNGPPVNGQPVDTVPYSGLLQTAPTTCPAPGTTPPPELFPTGGGPLTAGDIVIIDGPAVPTSKDQCKNAGWRNFPGIKSQGQCVALVERHPQP
jgi:hypothetical protein